MAESTRADAQGEIGAVAGFPPRLGVWESAAALPKPPPAGPSPLPFPPLPCDPIDRPLFCVFDAAMACNIRVPPVARVNNSSQHKVTSVTSWAGSEPIPPVTKIAIKDPVRRSRPDSSVKIDETNFCKISGQDLLHRDALLGCESSCPIASDLA